MATPQVGKALVYNPDGKILTLFRSETHPHLAHYVDFAGGLLEDGESPEGGMAREIEEETGINVDVDEVDIALSGTSKNSNGKGETHYSLGKVVLTDTPEITLSWEHERYEWLSRDDLLAQMATQTDATDTFWEYVKKHLASS